MKCKAFINIPVDPLICRAKCRNYGTCGKMVNYRPRDEVVTKKTHKKKGGLV